MIKVIVERRVKEGENLAPLLRELRAAAMHQPGYITGETLVSTEDKSIITVISTWHSLEAWKAWETSGVRAGLYQQIETLLIEKPKVKTYQINPTDFNFSHAKIEDLKGGEVHENARICEAILDGEKGPKRDICLFNAGAAIYVAGIAKDLAEGIEKAKESIDSGAAKSKLEELRQYLPSDE